MQHTDAAIVEEGVTIVSSVAKETNLIFENYLVMQTFDAKIPDNLGGKKKKVLKYYLNKPWEMPIFKGI
jgi:hypothetical protein